MNEAGLFRKHSPQGETQSDVKSGSRRGLGALLIAAGFAMCIPGFVSITRDASEPVESFVAASSADFERTPNRDPGGVDWRDEPPSGFAWRETPAAASPDPVEPSSAFDCMLLPWEEVEIRSPVIGRIDAIHVARAEAVEAGQLLVELDAPLARAELELARKRAAMRSSVDAMRARHALGVERAERAEQLFSNSAMALEQKQEILAESEIVGFELDEAKDRRALARLQLDLATAEFERRQIRSPIAGVIVDRKMTVGEVVDEETVLEIAQLDPLRVEVVLPAERFGAVRTGMKAVITPEIGSGGSRIATVQVVDKLIDSASGTFGAALRLPNPDFSVPSGLRCEVRFLDGRAEGDPVATLTGPSVGAEDAIP